MIYIYNHMSRKGELCTKHWLRPAFLEDASFYNVIPSRGDKMWYVYSPWIRKVCETMVIAERNVYINDKRVVFFLGTKSKTVLQ